ncbi:S16 family serine protease [Rhodococcoides kyotonense]|uniref:S16 family serine protease n=1 Tax=Rhodococcoides kyotonense TaxID=398843 RepID=UPI001FE889E4|nr:S16 family serine protease [Rhodococcus kyotonensis]
MRKKRAVALAAAVMLTAGCASTTTGTAMSEGMSAVSSDVRSITISPLFTRGNGEGGVGEEVVSRSDTSDSSFRVDFSEDEVSGLGDASRAASWNAAIVSTLLMSQPLNGRFEFEITGSIDGPSAGALKTVALVALQRGEQISSTATMTGTINATGTIGPVGGIPEKVAAAGADGFDTVLIPLGQRNSVDRNGDSVDVVRVGERAGVNVVEVGDIFEAYGLLTGSDLEQPRLNADTRLDNRAYDKIDAQFTAAMGRYDAALVQLNSLNVAIARTMTSTGLPDSAAKSAERARDLQRQGLAAGALVTALEAAAVMEAAYAVGNSVTPLLTQGPDGLSAFVTQATNTGPAEAAFFSFLDSLATFEPKTLTDVEAIVNAYAGTFDALTILDFAVNELEAMQDRMDQRIELEEFVSALSVPLIYLEAAKSQLAGTKVVWEVGRDNPGATIDSAVDLQQVGDFFRRGADANLAAFRTGFPAQVAERGGRSIDSVISRLSYMDIDVAAAVHQKNAQPAIEKYLGEGTPSGFYATLGYGVSNYVRNQQLVEKYYNNAITDENLAVTGFLYENALSNAFDLARAQLSSDIAELQAGGTQPVITVGQFESASVRRAGTPIEQFNALGAYNSGYLTTRVMTYLSSSGK